MDKLFLTHVILMGLALILVISAVIIAHKKRDGWFPRHRKLALSGSLCALLGVSAIVTLKLANHYPHLKSPHAIAGALGLLLLILTPVIGMLLAAGKESFRPVHRLFGRITSIVVILTATMGILRLLQMRKS